MSASRRYRSAFANVGNSLADALRTVQNEEARASRDSVLLALAGLKATCAEQGIDIPSSLVLRVYREFTGERADRSLSLLVSEAQARCARRAKGGDPFQAMEQAVNAVRCGTD